MSVPHRDCSVASGYDAGSLIEHLIDRNMQLHYDFTGNGAADSSSQSGSLRLPARSVPSSRRRSSCWLAAAAGFVVMAVALSVWMLSGGQPTDVPSDAIREPPLVQPAEPLPSDTPPVPVPPPLQPQMAPSNYVAVMVVCALVLMLIIVLRSLRWMTASRPFDSDLHLPEDAHLAMATNLAREIHQRLTPDRITTH
jgi:hypothetical protein